MSLQARNHAAVFTGWVLFVRTHNFCLAIENKPWANDGAAQLQRYFDHFDQNCTIDYRIIYLTPKGTAPSFGSISEIDRKSRIDAGQLHLWGYQTEIQAWLMKCRAECGADRVSTFIDEFSRYIRTIFEGVRDRTMNDHLLDEITGSDVRVSSAMQVISMADAIRKRLLAKLGEQLRDELPGHGVEIFDDPGAKYSGITITYSGPSSYNFGLEFQNTQFNGLIFGFYYKNKVNRDQFDSNEYQRLSDQFGKASQSEFWLWNRKPSTTDSLLPVPPDWQVAPEPWIEIANGTMAKKITEAFRKTHAVLTACGPDTNPR